MGNNLLQSGAFIYIEKEKKKTQTCQPSETVRARIYKVLW